MSGKRTDKTPPSTSRESKPPKTPLALFRVWWRSLPTSLRIKPDLPPARRAKVDYIGFIERFREYWLANGAAVIADLAVEAEQVATRNVRETRTLMRAVIAAAKGLLREDFRILGESLGDVAPLLASGGTLARAVRRWVRECHVHCRLVELRPWGLPPMVAWGCAPERYDAAPGLAAFGLWSTSPTGLPWWNYSNITMTDGAGGTWNAPADLAGLVAAAVDLCWRERLGHGPESWNEFLRESSSAPLWIGWTLYRLVQSWVAPPTDERDVAALGVHLLQVANGYRNWLREYFDSSNPAKAGDATLDEVYPAAIAGLDPRVVATSPTGPDVAALHRIGCFVWYAGESIAAAGVARRKKNQWHQLAWVGPFFKYYKMNPTCRIDEVAQAIGVSPSTIRKFEPVAALFDRPQVDLPQGKQNKDGTFEPIAPPRNASSS